MKNPKNPKTPHEAALTIVIGMAPEDREKLAGQPDDLCEVCGDPECQGCDLDEAVDDDLDSILRKFKS